MNKIHGETRIVLRNPISGNIVKDVTSENTFQGSVIAQGLRNLGVQCITHAARPDGILGVSDISRQEGYSWRNTVGGLLLFRDSIQVGTMFMPAGNKMVGNGSFMVSNADTPNELGSYNSQESSESLSAITQVYDFSTNQANGQISCVCLSSQVGGFMGYGNPSGGVIASAKKRYLTYNQGYNVFTAATGQATRNNKTYTFSYNNTTKVMTVTVTRAAFTQAGVKSFMMAETKEHDLSQVITLSDNWFNFDTYSQDGRYVYISIGCDSIWRRDPNTTMYYLKYDIDTDTFTQETLINTSTETLRNQSITVAGGLAFWRGVNDDVTCVFDLSNNVHIKTLAYGTGACRFTEDLLLTRINGSDDYIAIYDPVNDTIYPTNAKFDIDYGWPRFFYYDATTNTVFNQGLRVFNNPLYLATINNLDSPVTKTSAQTMKITYSLTEA